MASNINSVVLTGNLTRDPELSALPNSNTSICKFSIANNRSFSSGGEKKDQTSFFNCVAWGKLGELIDEYCRKGNKVAITGRLQQRTWEDKDGGKRSAVEVIVEGCEFLTLKADGGQVPFADATPFTDDDIPFA